MNIHARTTVGHASHKPSSTIRKPCARPGCNALVQLGNIYCVDHYIKTAQEYSRVSELKRQSSYDRGYNGRWRKARKSFLIRNPMCKECEKTGKLTPASVVDHITPHKQDASLMWDQSNWQALCKRCHDKKTANEDGGFGR